MVIRDGRSSDSAAYHPIVHGTKAMLAVDCDATSCICPPFVAAIVAGWMREIDGGELVGRLTVIYATDSSETVVATFACLLVISRG